MVGLVLVSHSSMILEGIRELVNEMAKGMPLYLAGGSPEGGLGTNYELIKAAIQKSCNSEGTVILYDIGSSFMTAELVLEELDDSESSTVKIMKAPLVEGSIVAAVEISAGASFATVCESLKEIEMIK
jgi:dihydroxyacetone kinase phosphotransfer subunit